jgi:hypothetical protein
MNKSFCYKLLLAIVVFCQTVGVAAQISEGGVPPSFRYETMLKSHPVTIEVPVTFNVADLKVEDERRRVEGITPPRIATSIDVALSLSNAGQWSTLPGGESICQLHLHARGAEALMIYYSDFYIPKGGKLYIYNADKTQVLGAYTYQTHPSGGAFATEMIAGDELVFEYVAATDGEMPRIDIASVGYAYNHVFIENGDISLRAASEPCNVNINCEEGADWQDQKKGVCYMVQKIGDKAYMCTGSLINNTDNDLKPYIISASHCAMEGAKEATADDMSQWLFYFHKEYESCSNASGIVTPKTMVGCKKIAMTDMNGESDGLLLLLNASVPENYDVYYNGWDRRSTPARSGVGIHHPNGDMKKISTFTEPVTTATFQTAEGHSEPNAHWNATFVATENGHGITEGGSSGSPLFNENKLIVGTLTGGNSSCDYLHGLNLYGKLGYHWNRYTKSDNTRMDKWLDPLNSGVETLQGRYYNTTVLDPPVDLEAKLQSNQTVLLTWKSPDSDTPTKYNVYRNYVKIAETTELSYIDASPQPGTQDYGVSCVDATGNESNIVSASILVRDFKAPVNVAATYTTQPEALITWDAPVYEQAIYWGDNEPVYQISLGNEEPYYFGQQWSNEDIRDLHKKTIKAVNFIPIEDNTYEIYISQGEGHVYRQKVTDPVYDDINTVELTTPFVIDGTKDLIVAIYISEYAQTGSGNEYPILCDAGPAVPGKGNIYSYDGVEWEALYDGTGDDSYSFNFFISAIVSSEEGEISISSRDSKASKSATRSVSGALDVRVAKSSFLSEPVGIRSSRPAVFPDITGYVVYRNNTKIATVPASLRSYTDGTAPSDSYYQLAAIYESGYEGVLSDKAYISLLNNKLNAEDPIALSPVVFTNQVEIQGAYQLKCVEIYDLKGVLCLRVDSPDRMLDTQSLSPGVYFFRLSTEKGKDVVLQGIKR